jgi:hypothetical protein
MRAFIFYPLAALAAAAAVCASLGPNLFPAEPGPQAGAAAGQTLVFGPAALTRFEVADTQVSYISRDDFWHPEGVQIATRSTQLDPSPADTGARLVLDPAQAAQFAGKPLAVQVKVRPLPYTNATALAAAAEAPGPTTWVVQKLPAESATLTFRFPAQDGAAPDAIGFWPIATTRDYDYGVEILEVRISPDPTQPTK